MKIRLLMLVLFLITSSAKFLQAQEVKTNMTSDTLVVVWSSGDPEVATKACLMYAHAAKKYKWFNEVILIVWGPSEKLLAENAVLKEKVAAMKKDGIIVEACVACSNMYNVTNELKVCQVDVKGMGVPLTRYLKRGYKIVSY
ncbi:MAG: DsrE family protein [Prolixibacteraceae bacterium]|nr:DsrE family protein [Prolixibacteraceae bacterium]